MSSFRVIPVSPSVVAFSTAPDIETARKIATAVLTAKAAACANLVPQVESHYWWQGKVEQAAEVLIIFKTTREKQATLEEVVRAHHPYETPEFIILPIEGGSQQYMAWIRGSVS